MVRRVALAALFLAPAVSCARPEPPTVKPEVVRVERISTAGVDVALRMVVTNPNAIGLGVRSVKATVRFDTGATLCPIVVPHAVSLPAKTPTAVEVPISLAWTNVVALAQIASARADVGYDLDGSAAVGGETLNFDIPFTIRGVLRQGDILKAALGSLPVLPIPLGR
jgi:LEA14-like dessication related protein